MKKTNFKRLIAVFLTILLVFEQVPIHTVLADASNASNQKKNEHRYQVFDISMSWKDAKAYCEKMGGHLATITSAAEQSKISSLGSSKMNLWLGAIWTSRGFEWVTGEPFGYSYWCKGEPNGGIDGCLMIYTANSSRNDLKNKYSVTGTWNDHSMFGGGTDHELGSFGFICEWEEGTGEITLDKKIATILKDESITLKATVDSSIPPQITWSSSDNSIAEVDKSGKVTGKKPGTAVITATTDKGKYAKCKINVFYIDSNSFLFGAKQNDTMEGPRINFFGTQFPMFRFDIGTTIDMKYVQCKLDESEKKIIVKIGKMENDNYNSSTDDPYWKKEYNEIKQMANKIGVKNDNEFYNSFRDFRKKMKKNKSFLGIEFNTFVYGYIEFDISSGEPVFTEGSVVLGGENDIDITAHPIPEVPPFYIKFGFESEANGKLTLTPKKASTYEPKYDVAGKLDYKFSPLIATGMDLIAAKLELGGKLTVNNSFQLFVPLKEAYEATCNGSLYIKFKMLIFEQEGSVTTKDYKLYPRSNISETFPIMDIANTDSFKITDRRTKEFGQPDILIASNSKDAFIGDFIDTLKKTERNVNLEMKGEDNLILKSNVYDYGEPVMTRLNDNSLLLIWVDDNQLRNNANRTTLMFSIYKNGVWSYPSQVDDDGTADFAPQLANINGKVYLVWENANRAFDDTVKYSDMAKQMDISFAEFSGNRFTKVSNITAPNDSFEMSPVIAGDENNISVVWIENSNNNILNLSGENSICSLKLSNGSWGKKQVLKNKLTSVGGLTADYLNGKEFIAYTTKAATGNTMELNTLYDNVNKMITNNNVSEDNVQISNKQLYWKENNSIKKIDINSQNKILDLGIELTADSKDIKVLENNGKKIVIWMNKSNFQNELFMSQYNSSNNLWDKSVQLTNNKKSIRDYAVLLDSKSKIVSALNLSEIQEMAANVSQPYGRTDLAINMY